ncbi:MAG: thiamine diphosphokinase [Firmicutes bacterium]|nr:thiamine diphosphokinase [Bacillota bacterium]
MARAVIITSYLEYPLDIPALLSPDDRIVCLDGGYDIACAQGIQPHLWLGDFDSLQGTLPESENGPGSLMEIRSYPPEKDYTDLELAFRALDPEETPNLLVIGGLGGRLDQTLVNIQMLQRYTAVPGAEAGAPKFRSIEMLDGHNRCFAVHGYKDAPGPESHWIHKIPPESGAFLSLLPLTEKCTGVTLRNARYPLENADLRRGASLSVSNEFTDAPAELMVRHGCLLVIIARGNRADRL